MRCQDCGRDNPNVARFCHGCGSPLVAGINRDDHFAGHPGESVRALALVSTLMPHVRAGRRHVYRLAVTVAVLAALVAAGFGILPVALVCAGLALPGALLTYLYDHDVWIDEPLALLGVAVVVAAGLGVGIGFCHEAFQSASLLVGRGNPELPLAQLLAQSLALPALTVAVLIVVPLWITSRPSLCHALDALSVSALAGTALAFADSVVVQHGAFSGLTAESTSPARDAFVALTLGFAKPLLYATATALAVMKLRRRHARASAAGLLQGFFLVAALDAGTATLSSYGERGVVLVFLLAGALAAVGLLAVRNEAHVALLGEVEVATHATTALGGHCAECGLPLMGGASFCLACGTAVAAMPKSHQRAVGASPASGSPLPSSLAG